MKSKQRLMAIAIGVCYVWFGVLKFFPDISPAEELVAVTVEKLFLGIIPDPYALYAVAFGEVSLGILLAFRWKRKYVASAVLVHLAFTFAPMFLMPEMCFNPFPALTLLGQYILKNLVFVSGVIYILHSD